MKKFNLCVSLSFIIFFLMIPPYIYASSKDDYVVSLQKEKKMWQNKKELPESIPRLTSSLTFEYPDAVRGIYVNAHVAGSQKWNTLVKLIQETELNSMVIDFKDDYGNLTYKPSKQSTYYKISKSYIANMPTLLEEMEKEKIYPIARVVVFKDTALAEIHPEWSFLQGDKVWRNGRNEAFVNPFIKEVWDYNINIAIEAAKMGFQEIQFDYVRFPEGFENKENSLRYSKGDYDKLNDKGKSRVQAVTDFVAYASDKLRPYGVKVSVDIFGYTATLEEASGIGQNFSEISQHVDVISSMIYPSHWGSYFGIDKPDLYPYELINEYIRVENSKLQGIINPPVSRPWLQDFTATWLGKGNYQRYEKEQIERQIKALNDNGVDEFLLWNSGNNYTEDVDYIP